MKSGDEIAFAGGQPLVSTADLTWVLHTASNETTLPIVVRRGKQNIETKLVLSGDWKKSDLGWRASSWWALRQGLKLNPVAESDPRRSSIPADRKVVLEVNGMFGKGAAPLQAAGLRKGDILLEVDGRPAPALESDFLVDLRTKHGPKDSVKFTVLRDGKRHEITIPMW